MKLVQVNLWPYFSEAEIPQTIAALKFATVTKRWRPLQPDLNVQLT